jgi:hypothetical protein
MSATAEQINPIKGKIPGIRDNKVYNDANSKDVEKYVLYSVYDGTTSEEDIFMAYKDQECTERVSVDEMRELYLKGVIVIMPITMGEDSAISYITPSNYTEGYTNGIKIGALTGTDPVLNRTIRFASDY